MVQLFINPASFSSAATPVATGVTAPAVVPPPRGEEVLSVLSYNVLLPNSVDGWWTYKMYDPPLSEDRKYIASWDYRKKLLRERLALIDADVVCFQEVAPVSFEDDFQFMEELGYDGVELFKKGRFRPATFWKSSEVQLVTPPVHKDRTLLTAFRPTKNNNNKKNQVQEKKVTEQQQQPKKKSSGKSSKENDNGNSLGDNNWYVLNCHLQAGKQGGRRVRQINEGVKAVMTMARKLKEKNPEESIRLIVCGDFNGGSECGAVRYLEDGYVDEHFIEDGEQISSKKKTIPLKRPLIDAVATVKRPQQQREQDQEKSSVQPQVGPPATLVVSERIKVMVEGADDDSNATTTAYEKPRLSKDMIERLTRIFNRFASGSKKEDSKEETKDLFMGVHGVEEWLKIINGQVGRGSEFREAGRQMGWIPINPDNIDERIVLPKNGKLSLDGFIQVYQEELTQGKFWGIAYDMAVLGEPLPDVGIYNGRYDRMYCSDAIEPSIVIDTISNQSCPNELEPSDHLPIAASFIIKTRKQQKEGTDEKESIISNLQ